VARAGREASRSSLAGQLLPLEPSFRCLVWIVPRPHETPHLYLAVPLQSAPLPDGTNRVLAVYNITGVEALLASEEVAARPNITGCVCCVLRCA
jgi:hypothetical protein